MIEVCSAVRGMEKWVLLFIELTAVCIAVGEWNSGFLFIDLTAGCREVGCLNSGFCCL